MSVWPARRFWTDVTIAEVGDGFTLHLDKRPLMTPAKAPLVVPTIRLAEGIAREWAAQEGRIDPATMPFTRSANATIDKLIPQFAEVAEIIADYGASDLICYRAESPAELTALQSSTWDPMLDWAASTLGVRLQTTLGVMPIAQDSAALERLHELVISLDPWALTAFHNLVSLSGSLVIAFAAIHGVQMPGKLWEISRIDEAWQEAHWGIDDEALAIAQRKKNDFCHAMAFYDLSRKPADHARISR